MAHFSAVNAPAAPQTHPAARQYSQMHHNSLEREHGLRLVKREGVVPVIHGVVVVGVAGIAETIPVEIRLTGVGRAWAVVAAVWDAVAVGIGGQGSTRRRRYPPRCPAGGQPHAGR